MENLVVLTGDIHTFIAGNLTTTGRQGGDPIGVELVGGSATSLGLPEYLGQSLVGARRRSAGGPTRTSSTPTSTVVDMPWSRSTKDKIEAEYKSVDALTKGASPQSLAKFEIEAGDPTLHEIVYGPGGPWTCVLRASRPEAASACASLARNLPTSSGT